MNDNVSKHRLQRVEERIAQLRGKQEIEAVEEIIEFNETPAELKAKMDRFVIGQEKGKKIMSTLKTKDIWVAKIGKEELEEFAGY